MSNAYAVRKSDGSILTTITEGSRDLTSTSLVLHGRGATEYGLERDENLVRLLENFAHDEAPSNPLVGQLWWNTNQHELYVYDNLGSPADWRTIIPTPDGIGFYINAGNGLTGGGYPSNSPLGVTLNVGAGTGITVSSNAVSVNESQINHDNLSGFVPNEHIDHSSVSILAGNGLTGGGTLVANRTLTVGAGDGITVSTNAVAVNNTVVRTSGNQTIGGTKTFSSPVIAPLGAPGAPSYSFSGDTDTGFYRSATNQLGFVTGGTRRFKIESNGTLSSDNTNYENLVTHDDDIPNKKYVDDAITSAVSSLNSATTYAGFVDAAATAEIVPSGWFVTRSAVGVYVVNHNLGLSPAQSLAVVVTPIEPFNGFTSHAIAPRVHITSPDTFTVIMKTTTGGAGGTAMDRAFFFIAARN